MDEATIANRLLHRDASVLVLDKPAGLPVHREPGAPVRETLSDWLEHLRFGLPRLPQLAHRLDAETSGCLVLGRHPRALARLSELFAANAVEKVYWAVVEGVPEAEAGIVDLAIAEDRRPSGPRRMRPDPQGKPATTRWRRLAHRDGRSWLELRPLTGRTHQLRVHCMAMGTPILGDRRYGGQANVPLHLQARRVRPPFRSGRDPIDVTAPVPAHVERALCSICAYYKNLT